MDRLDPARIKRLDLDREQHTGGAVIIYPFADEIDTDVLRADDLMRESVVAQKRFDHRLTLDTTPCLPAEVCVVVSIHLRDRQRLVRLKPLALELQSPTILGDRSHHVLRSSIRDVRLDLERHLDLGPF